MRKSSRAKLGISLLVPALISAPVFGVEQGAAPPAPAAPVDNGSHHQTAKGALGGAVVGHLMGRHAVMGAIAGGTAGAIKKHYDKKKARRAASEARSAE